MALLAWQGCEGDPFMKDKKKPEAMTSAMTDELRELVDRAQALVDATTGEADETIAEVRKNLQERLKWAKDTYGDASRQLADTLKAADDLVREKPYYAVGGAFLGGLLLGLLMARK